MSQNLQNFAKIQKFQLDNLVDFEKCCKTHIFLQKSVPIQPKTSNILPKFCQKLATTLRVRRAGRFVRVMRARSWWSSGPLALLDTAPRVPRHCPRGGRRPSGASPSASACPSSGSPGGFFENAFFKNFANFWRARSRLYQNEILQENMRSTAFFKLYKICILLHCCNLKIFAKNRFEKSAIVVKIQQKFCKCRKNLLKFAKFQKFQLENLVDFEKCCKTHI